MKSQNQTKEDWKYVEITYLTKKNKEKQLGGVIMGQNWPWLTPNWQIKKRSGGG